MKDGTTHLAYKPEHAVDLDTGAVVAAELHPADEGDTTTLEKTLAAAKENLEAVDAAPTAEDPAECVTDKGYHSRSVLKALDDGPWKTRISEPKQKGFARWHGDGAARRAVTNNRTRLLSGVAKEAFKLRAEIVERSFAHNLDRGGMRRTWLRGRENVHKRYLTTGYQEILTDPSYAGQIVTFTFPHIGNVGANPDDMESATPAALGCVLRAAITEPANWRAAESLDPWLADRGVVAITGIDTRRLARRIRDGGAASAALTHVSPDIPSRAINTRALAAEAAAWPGLEGMDLARAVTCGQTHAWEETTWTPGAGYGRQEAPSHHVVAVDSRTSGPSATSSGAWQRRAAGSPWCRRRRAPPTCWRTGRMGSSSPTARATRRRPAPTPCP